MLKQTLPSNQDSKLTISTPERPASLPKVELTENAHSVFIRRYARRNDSGKPIETVEDTFWRVAYNVAMADEKWGGAPSEAAKDFYKLLASKRFFPNSPTFTGAGTPLGQLAACFVLPISDDMGRRESGIFQTLRDAALIQQTGGGNGFSFSRLRPEHSVVHSSAGEATGPVGFLRVYDQAFGEVAQGGTRRGANMAVLRVDHPDIEDFIACKTNENAITNFNISVGITNAFMQAVADDAEWPLRFMDTTDERYRTFDGTLEDAEKAGMPILTHRTVNARELFDKIVSQAHHNGEPGLLFLDTANKTNPVGHLYALEATNPCGEQFLGPYENCCLGSINLAQHVGPNGTVDWERLKESVEISTHFLDNVVEANAYVPAVPQLQEAAFRARRIGLGIMGLADLMYHAGIRYGSEEGQEFVGQVMEFIRYHSMRTSIKLAEERGPFQAIEGSIYDPQAITWEAPQPIAPYRNDYRRPALDWDKLRNSITKHGIRNAAQTTIAPTGTIATVSGCEGYGCEPVFALAYIRHMNDNGKDLQLTYTSPLFEKALVNEGLDRETRQRIIEQVVARGSCQGIEELPAEIAAAFVVSSDITAEEHVRMQAALQAFVDNSLSKTINFPADATEADVAKAYQLAWELGCKGITVYVTGSREKVVLETHATAKKKEKDAELAEMPVIWNQTKKPRPRSLVGQTYHIQTPVGKAFVTINENGHSQPFEVFLNTAKAGSETAAVSEAIGRLLSYILRLASPVVPRKRLYEIHRQLKGIGGSRSSGFGPNRVSSLPDGVAQIIGEYLENTAYRFEDEYSPLPKTKKPNGTHTKNGEADLPLADEHKADDQRVDDQRFDDHRTDDRRIDIQKVGDICPECGHASVINEEGCRKCYNCGYSEC